MMVRFAIYALGACSVLVAANAEVQKLDPMEGEKRSIEDSFWENFVESDEMEMSVATSGPSTPSVSSPTMVPSVGPCVFNITVGCFFDNGDPCDMPMPTTQICTGRPYKAGMLYNGGDCSQSFNTQSEVFSCTDYDEGPPTEIGEQSWITVTDASGDGIVYHDNWVSVGDIYYLDNDEQRFGTDQIIYIYSSDEKDEDSLLQYVEYNTACTGDLALKDRFGASQLVEWFNLEQGLVSCSTNISYTIGVDIPSTVNEGITVESAIVVMNFGEEMIDLTSELAGTFIPAGTILPVTIPNEIDLTEDFTYTFRIEIIGTDADGATCVGSGYDEFTAGPSYGSPTTPVPSTGFSSSPPAVPTALPGGSSKGGTSSPTVSDEVTTVSPTISSGSSPPAVTTSTPEATLSPSFSPGTSKGGSTLTPTSTGASKGNEIPTVGGTAAPSVASETTNPITAEPSSSGASKGSSIAPTLQENPTDGVATASPAASKGTTSPGELSPTMLPTPTDGVATASPAASKGTTSPGELSPTMLPTSTDGVATASPAASKGTTSPGVFSPTMSVITVTPTVTGAPTSQGASKGDVPSEEPGYSDSPSFVPSVSSVVPSLTSRPSPSSKSERRTLYSRGTLRRMK